MRRVVAPQTPKQVEAGIRLADLSHNFENLRHRFGEAARPLPAAIWNNRVFQDMRAGRYQLQPEHFRDFPVELSSIVRGDYLHAYFDCYVTLGTKLPDDKPVHTRLQIGEIEQVAAYLREQKHTPITEWNLLQCNAALNFAALIEPVAGRGIPCDLVDSFRTDEPAVFTRKLGEFRVSMPA